MPTDLQDHIKSLAPEARKQIWVSCDGANTADRENVGPIKYELGRGFPSFYYPFTNVDGYLSPIIAVQLERPKCKLLEFKYQLKNYFKKIVPTVRQIINIECRAWAKNIEYNGSYRDRQGSVHIEVMVD